MKRLVFPAAVLFGAVLAMLRFLELNRAYDADGLPLGGPLPLLCCAFSAAAALVLLFAARSLPAGETLCDKMENYFPFDSTLSLFLTVLGCFAVLASCALRLLFGGNRLSALIAVFELCGVAAVFYAVFSLRRRQAFVSVALLVPVCALVMQLIVTYRGFARDPILGHYYVQLLAVAALCYALLQLASFAFRRGSLRLFAWSSGLAAVLCLGSCANTGLAELTAYLGAALILLGFLAAMETE